MNPWFQESGGAATNRNGHGEACGRPEDEFHAAGLVGTADRIIDRNNPPTNPRGREDGKRGPVVLIQNP